MKTAVAETSLATYRALKQEQKLQPMQQRIMDVLKDERCYTRKELAKRTGFELSSVCGRVNSLIAAGLVMEAGERIDEKTGKPQGMVRLVPKQRDWLQ